MLSIKELKQAKEEAYMRYDIACNVELIKFVKQVTDIYKYRLQITNVDYRGASGIIWHDDKIEPAIILKKIESILEYIDSNNFVFINYEGIVKFGITY
jgi:hypothetical protein